MRRSRSALMRQIRSRFQSQRGEDNPELYWWLLGMLRGQRMVDGPYRSEQEAKGVARDKFDEGRWRAVPLRTRDPSRAKQVLRHQLVTQSNVGIDNAMEPMRRPTNITSVD